MFSSNVGLFHTLFAVISIIVGAWVIFLKKGTSQHKLLGYIYFLCMLIMNISALFTQALYDFGPFHWMAIGSLIFVSIGVSAPIFLRKTKHWFRIHYDFILWSYVGLVAAFFSELFVRLPIVDEIIGGGFLFWALVILASALTFSIGGYFIHHNRKNYAKLLGRI